VGAVSAVAIGTASAGPSVRTAAASGRHFTVVEHAITDTVADTGPKGDSLGDVLAFGNPIYNAANRMKIGSDNGSCIRTAVAKAWECSWTTTLAGGSLVVEGPFYDTKDSVLAITGGTGKWMGARGQMVLHARNAAGSSYDFRFDVV
jgi:allene oxide cyclase